MAEENQSVSHMAIMHAVEDVGRQLVDLKDAHKDLRAEVKTQSGHINELQRTQDRREWAYRGALALAGGMALYAGDIWKRLIN